MHITATKLNLVKELPMAEALSTALLEIVKPDMHFCIAPRGPHYDGQEVSWALIRSRAIGGSLRRFSTRCWNQRPATYRVLCAPKMRTFRSWRVYVNMEIPSIVLFCRNTTVPLLGFEFSSCWTLHPLRYPSRGENDFVEQTRTPQPPFPR